MRHTKCRLQYEGINQIRTKGSLNKISMESQRDIILSGVSFPIILIRTVSIVLFPSQFKSSFTLYEMFAKASYKDVKQRLGKYYTQRTNSKRRSLTKDTLLAYA